MAASFFRAFVVLTLISFCAAPAFAEQRVQRAARADSRLNGFLIGLVAGLVPGIYLGMGINRYCENESSRGCPAAIAVAGTAFGVAGGGIGYAIDGLMRRETTVLPRPAVRFTITF